MKSKRAKQFITVHPKDIGHFFAHPIDQIYLGYFPEELNEKMEFEGGSDYIKVFKSGGGGFFAWNTYNARFWHLDSLEDLGAIIEAEKRSYKREANKYIRYLTQEQNKSMPKVA